MKKIRILYSVFVLFFLSTMSYGQACRYLSYQLRAAVRHPKPVSYPRKVQTGIVYTLNGKRTIDEDYVRRVLSKEHLLIDTLLVGLPHEMANGR